MPICVTVVTQSRSDYGIYYPLLCALRDDSRFDLCIYPTGMHCEAKYGATIGDVLSDFGKHCETQFKKALMKSKWLVVLGDTRPMLEATIEAAYRSIPIAHIQGGDKTGNIDEPCRHAITKFAHLHFSPTEVCKERLIQMGEEPWRIHMVGPLGIFAMPVANCLDKISLCLQLGLEINQPIILVIQHPVSTEVVYARAQMQATLDAMRGRQTVVIYPNNDPGSEAMIEAIKQCLWVKSFVNLPYMQFLSLLRCASVIVGNSSAGIVESALFGIPAVNIGSRQEGREQSDNIINCTDAINPKVIRQAVQMALDSHLTQYSLIRCNPYQVNTDGVKIILNTLANTQINERLLQKRLTY